MNEIVIPETRGRPKKYNFDEFELFETRIFDDTTTSNLRMAAKAYVVRKGLNWRFRCYTINGAVHIVRIG